MSIRWNNTSSTLVWSSSRTNLKQKETFGRFCRWQNCTTWRKYIRTVMIWSKIWDGVVPQFDGLVFSLMHLLHNSEDEEQVQWCSKHVSRGKFSLYKPWEISECIGCQGMLKSMVDATCYMRNGKQMPCHGYNTHFDNNLFSVMCDIFKVIKKNWAILFNKKKVLNRLSS